MDASNTFTEWLDRVLVEREEDGVRGIDSEKNRASVHVRPAAFATKPIGDIKSAELRDWLREMQKKPAKDTRGERSLNVQTVARSWALVRNVFTSAHEREVIAVNPCHGIKLKKRADERATREPWAYFTPEEQERFRTYEMAESTRLQILFAMYMGLRQGEQFNLLLEDLHVDNEKPHVVIRFGSKNLPPKSGKTRRLPLHPLALDVAKRWLDVLPQYAPSNPERLVFPSPLGKRRAVGKPLGRIRNRDEWICGWRHTCLVARVKKARWHDLRHTCASSLIAGWWGRKWTIEEVKEFLGHSSSQITARYAHLAGTVLEEAARETIVTPKAEHAEPRTYGSLRAFARRLAKTALRVVRSAMEAA
jgi:integrase